MANLHSIWRSTWRGGVYPQKPSSIHSESESWSWICRAAGPAAVQLFGRSAQWVQRLGQPPYKCAKATLALLLLVALPARSPAEASLSDTEATIVIYNKNDPQSQELALYYSVKRNIPGVNLCSLDCPLTEEITREQYNKSILRPLREFLQSRDLMKFGPLPGAGAKNRNLLIAIKSHVRYLVLCRGIPLKISQDDTVPVEADFKDFKPELLVNAAAVDSELANLPAPQLPITSYLPNPLFRKKFSDFQEWNHRLLCVARLDGPTSKAARRLIDSALEAEKNGLYGRAFFDLRNIPDSDKGYKWGDDEIRLAKHSLEERAWETVVDEKAVVFGDEVDASSCAIYAGWYTSNLAGPFASPDFVFRPGAIAYHIHSWSAATLRSETSGWAGPLVSHGAAATLGCVYEPYLQITPCISVLVKKLLEGCTFGEAAYSSQEFLSWMTTVIGDPLYRPFAISNEKRIADYEARYASLDANEKSSLAWAYRLKARQIYVSGKPSEALQLAFDQAMRLENRASWTGLANLYLMSGDIKRAAEAAKAAVPLAREQGNQQGTLCFAARTCAQARDWDASVDYYRALLTEFPKMPDFINLCREAESVAIQGKRSTDIQFFQKLQLPKSPEIHGVN